MAQSIVVPSGDRLEFPDGMPDSEIEKVIHAEYPDLAPKPSLMSRAGAALKPAEREPMPSTADTINAGWTNPPEERLSVPGSVMDKVPVSRLPVTPPPSIESEGSFAAASRKLRANQDAAAVSAERAAMPSATAIQPGTPSAGDFAKAVKVGTTDIGTIAGKGLRYLGAEDFGSLLQSAGQRQAKETQRGMTPAGQMAMDAPIVTDEIEWGETPMASASLQALRSAPSMIAALPFGGVAAKGIEAAGGATLKALAAHPGIIGRIAALAPTAIGVGGAEGIQAALMNAAQTETEIMELPIQQLRGSPKFQELMAQADPAIPLAQRERQVRAAIAKLASDEVARRTFVSTGGIGILTGGGAQGVLLRQMEGKGAKTILGAAGKGTVEEAIQEAPQSAAEQYIQNVATQNYVDPASSASQGVISAGLSGGIVGGLTGGVMGAGGRILSGAPGQEKAPSPRAELDAILSSEKPVAEILAAQAPAAAPAQATQQAPLQPAAFGWPDIKTPAVATLPDGQIITGQIESIQDDNGTPVARFIGPDGMVWMLDQSDAEITAIASTPDEDLLAEINASQVSPQPVLTPEQPATSPVVAQPEPAAAPEIAAQPAQVPSSGQLDETAAAAVPTPMQLKMRKLAEAKKAKREAAKQGEVNAQTKKTIKAEQGQQKEEADLTHSSGVKFLADASVAISGGKQGFDGLDANSRRRMQDTMLRVGHDPQILKSVIELIPVDVVDMFARQQLTPEMLFQNPSMFEVGGIRGDGNPAVAIPVNASAAIIRAMAGVAAKNKSFFEVSHFGRLPVAQGSTDGARKLSASPSGVGLIEPSARSGAEGSFAPNIVPSSTEPHTAGGARKFDTRNSDSAASILGGAGGAAEGVGRSGGLRGVAKKLNTAQSTIERKHDVTPSSDVVTGAGDVSASSAPSIMPQAAPEAGALQGELTPAENRRSNLDLRQRFDAMAPEEKSAALADLHQKAYVSDLTGLLNKRAFEEHVQANPADHVLYGDVDGLKALNTRYGHNGADQLLKAVGEVKAAVASEMGVNAFHRSGDEFLATHPDSSILEAYGREVQRRLDALPIEVTRPDGSTEIHVGVGLSYGVGKNDTSAETRANTQKAERKAGKGNAGAVPVAAAGRNEDNQGRGEKESLIVKQQGDNQPEERAYTKGQAEVLSRRMTNQGLPSEAYPHPTEAGMWAIRVPGEVQPADAGADFLASNRAEFRHEGFRIYPISIKGEPRWAVQSLDNSEREKKGERQLGGDAIVDTPEQAKQQAESQVTERSQKAEDQRQFAEHAAAEEAKKETNRGLSITQRRANAALDKPTNLPVNAGVGRGTRREAMESAVSQERAINAVDVRDTAAYKRDEDEQGRLHRAGYGAFFGNDSHPQKMRFNELSAKLKNRDNYQKKEYRLYMGRDTEGSFYDITKTEYDYAQTLIAAKKAEASTPAPSTPTAKKEPWQYGELEYGDKYIDEVVLPQLRKDLENAHGGKFQEYKSKAAAVRGLKERIDTLENHRDAKSRKYYASLDDHYAAVRRALAAGKDVPPVAYASYDDLKADVSAGRIKGDGQEVARVEQPQHIEAGQAEPATAPVIAASIKESAKNTPMNIEQAREWLLSEIDKAIIDAKSAKDEDVWDRAEGKVDLKGRMDVKETIGYKVFDVPGDGRFSVLNLKESLQKFKKQVAATPGFKKNATRPMSVANGSGGKTSVRDMLEDGEYVLAVDYGRLIGEPLLFGAVRKGEAHPIAYTNAEPVDIKGIEAQVGREWNVTGKSFSWRVIETTTGTAISSESTKERAVSKAIAHVDEHGTDKLTGAIERVDKVSQAELERQFTDWGSEEEAKAQKTRDAVERADTEDRALWNSIFPLKDGEKRSPNPWNDIDHMQAVVLAKDAAKAGKGDEFVSLIERRRGGTNNMLALAARKALADAAPKSKPAKGTIATGVASKILGDIYQRAAYNKWTWDRLKSYLTREMEEAGVGKSRMANALEKAMTEYARTANGRLGYPNSNLVFSAMRDYGLIAEEDAGAAKAEQSKGYPFYSNNKLFNAEGTAELPKDWTGVARSDSGKRFFYLGQENGERSFNPLKAESYEDALKEADGLKNDKPVIPEGYREVARGYFGGTVEKPIYAPFSEGERVRFIGGHAGNIQSFIGGPVTTGAIIKYDNGLTGRAEWRDVEAVKKPAAAQEPKNFKSIDALNAANNPLGEDDWIRFADGSEWQVKGRMNGWVLMQGKTEHPTVKNIMGQVPLIRSVIEANDAAQPKPNPIADAADAMIKAAEAMKAAVQGESKPKEDAGDVQVQNRIRTYWMDNVVPPLRDYFAAYRAMGADRLERNGIKPEGMSATDWLMSFSRRESTWSNGRKTGETGIQYLSHKDLWPTGDDKGEILRKAMLASIKALKASPGSNGAWIESAEQGNYDVWDKPNAAVAQQAAPEAGKPNDVPLIEHKVSKATREMRETGAQAFSDGEQRAAPSFMSPNGQAEWLNGWDAAKVASEGGKPVATKEPAQGAKKVGATQAPKLGTQMDWREFGDYLSSVSASDAFGNVSSKEKREWAAAGESWQLLAVDPKTLDPVPGATPDTSSPIIVSHGDVLDGRSRRAEATANKAKAIAAWVASDEKVGAGDVETTFNSLEDDQRSAVSRAIDRAIAIERGQDVKPLQVIRVRNRIGKLRSDLEAGKISEALFISQVESLHAQMEIAAESRKYEPTNGRARGADFLRQKLLEAKRRGDISEQAADMAEWFILKNPALVEDLGIGIRTPSENQKASGNYNPLNRVMTLFKESASDTTAVHEILHHLERMMPAEMQAEIRKEWRKAATKELLAAMKAKDQPRIDYFKAVLAGDQKVATELLTGKGMGGFNAPISDATRAKRIFHSTSTEAAALKILEDGEIRPPDNKHARGKLAPVVGRTYVSPSLETASIYSLGGVMMGNDYNWQGRTDRAAGRYGYIFEIDPSSYGDVQPDEDSVGELAADAMKDPNRNSELRWLADLAQTLGTPNQIRDAKFGEYAAWAQLGKKLVKHMNDAQKTLLIDKHNAHIANQGPLKIARAWKVDKSKAKEIARDGSNVLDVAEQVYGEPFNAVEPAPTFKAVDTALTIGEIPNTGKGFAEDTRVYLTEVIPQSFKLYRSVWVGENEAPRLDSPGAYWAETPEGARRSGFPPEQGKRRQILLEIVATRDSIDVAQSIARRRQYGEPEIVLNKPPEAASVVDVEEKVGGAANRDQMLQRVESAIAEIEARAIEASGHAWKTLSQDKATKALLNETRSAIVSAQTKQLNLDAEANYASIEGAPSLTDVLDALARATNTAIDAIRAEVFGPRLIGNTGAFDPTNPDIRQDLAIGQDYQYLNPSEFWAVRMTNTMAARFEAKSIWARSLQWLREALEHIKGALGLKSDHPLLKALDDLIKNGTGEFQSKEMLGSSEVYASIEESGPEEVAGVVMRDVSLAARLLLHPRQIAANHKPFVPVFDTAIKQFEERDRIVSGLGEMAKPYFELTHAQRLNVNKIVEQGRLDRTVYTVADLENGIHHAESGDLVILDAEEIGAYKSLRRTFNEALSLFRDTMLEEFGFAELIPEQKAAAKLRQMIADGEIEESRIEWARHVAKAIDEIEQAKRTGYAPFNRYGQFVVAVKALPAGVEVQDDDGKQLVTGIPEYGDDPLTQIVTDLGGQYDVFRDGWVIDDTRNAVLRALETTLFATKVEVNAFNEWRKQGKDVTAIPEVKAAFDEAKRKYGKAPNARVLAFHITEKAKADDANLSTFDELARISDVDVETWDAVREKLQEAIKAKSFRKHFFGSDNTPGYSVDFERSVADYIIGMSGYLARRKHVKDFDNAIKHIKAPALAKYAEDYRKYVNSPADEFALLKNIGFLYYIAGSTATAVANLTQVPIMTTSTLVQFVPHHIMAREVARAWGETLAMFSPTTTGLQMFDPAKVPADVRDVFKTAWEDQLFVPLETLDLMAASSIKTVGGRRTMRALSVTTQAIAYMFMFAERLNRITTFIAGQRISRMKVAKDRMRDVVKNDAWARHSIGGRAWGERNFAEWVVDESQYRMGKVNRPTVMRGVGSPLLQFKGFMMQTLEAGYRMAVMHGKGGKPAALAALGMMLLFGGIWAFPGLEDLREMIERLYKLGTGKDLDLKTEVRQVIARETGSAALAAAANKGIPYATVGMDMSRVGLGNIIPDSALQVAGIPVDLTIARPLRAAEKMAAGKTIEAMSEFLPNFLKNPAMGLQWKRDGLRDKLGTRMMTPGEFDYGDVAIKSLGWTPTKVTNRREYTYAESRAERGIDELKRRYTNDLVRAYVHEAEAKDPAEKAEYKADQAKILARIEEHNKTASPENLIKLDPDTLRRKAAAEFSGSAAREGKERKLSRGAAQDRRELFQLGR